MTKEIPLTKGYVALIDDEDYDRVNQYNWQLSTSYGRKYKSPLYAARYITVKDGKRITQMMHKFILNTTQLVDHINRDGLDNRKCNLRLATFSQNNQNMVKRKSAKCHSKYKGVDFHKGMHKWRARIYSNYKETIIGYFDSEINAAKAYDKAALELFGKFARVNFAQVGDNSAI